MTTNHTRRGHGRLVVAGAVALLLGTASCGQPVNLEVGAGVPRAEPKTGGSHAPPTPDEPAGDDAATPTPGPVAAPPEDPVTGDPPTEGPITGDPAPEKPAAEKPATHEPAPEEPAVDRSGMLEEGARGEAVLALQERLAELGYWVGPADGAYGHLTAQAVMAFQGWEGLTRDGRVGPETRAALRDAAPPQPDAEGDLIEVYLTEQVLLVVRDGRTVMALHTSTGSGKRYTQPSGRQAVADTPVGEWEISWLVDGWRESDLGRLWRPAYFHQRGIAIHGYPRVPAHPASHGCVRVSMPAMDVLWAEGYVTEGTRVVVS